MWCLTEQSSFRSKILLFLIITENRVSARIHCNPMLLITKWYVRNTLVFKTWTDGHFESFLSWITSEKKQERLSKNVFLNGISFDQNTDSTIGCKSLFKNMSRKGYGWMAQNKKLSTKDLLWKLLWNHCCTINRLHMFKSY